MREFHERIAKVSLDALDIYGYVLAGGHAVSMNGIGNRPSQDVDLFTAVFDEARFDESIQVLEAALDSAGFTLTQLRRSSLFFEGTVADKMTGESSAIDVKYDFRQFPPARFTLGPVLDIRDAAANKTGALYRRSEARDFMDVAGFLYSGKFTKTQLLELADGTEAEPLDRAMFAQQLEVITRLDPEDFSDYGASEEARLHLIETFTGWAQEIRQSLDEDSTSEH